MPLDVEFKSINIYSSINVAGTELPEIFTGVYSSSPTYNSTINCGVIPLSSTGITNLVITNVGSSSFDIIGININPLTNYFATPLSSTNFTVFPGNSETIPIVFNPTEIKTYNASLQVIVDGAVNGTNFNYDLIGVCTESYYATQYPIGTTIDFGRIPVYTTSISSFWLSCVGLLDLTVNSVAIGGTNANQFSIYPSLSAVLPPLSSLNYDITFYPTTYGTKNANLYLYTNGGTITYPLVGVGLSAIFYSNPINGSTINFGTMGIDGNDVDTGLATNIESLIIGEDGNVPYTVYSVSLSSNNDSALTISPTLVNEVIDDGETQTLTLTLTPDDTFDQIEYGFSGIITVDTSLGTKTYNVEGTVEDGDFMVSNDVVDFGTGLSSDVLCSAESISGTYLIGGWFDRLNESSNYSQAFIEIDKFGNEVTAFDLKFDEVVTGVFQDSENNVIILGNFTGYDSNGVSGICKMDSSFTTDFSSIFGTGIVYSSYGQPIRMIETISGDYLIVGDIASYNGNNKYGIVKMQKDGTDISGTLFGTSSPNLGFNGIPYSVIEDSDGNYVIGGYFSKYKTYTSTNNIVKIDASTGDKIDIFGSGFNSSVIKVIEDSDGNYIFVGSFTTYKSISVGKIVKTDRNGNILNTFGGGFNSYVYNIIQPYPGYYLIATVSSLYKGTPCKGIVFMDSEGNLVNTFGVGGILQLLYDSDGYILATGEFYDYSDLTPNYISKYDLQGNINPPITKILKTNSNQWIKKST